MEPVNDGSILLALKATIKRFKFPYFVARKIMMLVRFIKLKFVRIIVLLFGMVERIGASRQFRSPKFQSLLDDYAVSQVGAEHYLVSTSDLIIGKSLYVRGEFDFDKFALAWKLSGLEKASAEVTIIDVGANIGSIGIPAVKRGYAARCLAFEPEPLNARLLKINIILNDLEDKFDVFQVAVGNKVDEITFELSDSNFGDHRVRLNPPSDGMYGEQDRETILVPMRTLDDYSDCISTGMSIMWMDTQGFEGHVLQGANHLLEQGVPMVLEFWPYGLKRSGGYELLLESLDGSKYKYFIKLDANDTRKIPLSRVSLDVFCSELEKGVDGFADILVLCN